MHEEATTAVYRKQPRQARSRAMCDLILQATAEIIAKGGTAAVNTNYVAARAGVSIGSLYQYFPDKGALLSALGRQHTNRLTDCYDAVLSCASGQTLEGSIRGVIHGLARYLDANRLLHITLERDVMCVPEYPFPEALQNNAGLRKLRELLDVHRDEIHVEDLDLATFMVGRMLRQVINGSIRRRDGAVAPMEGLAEELIRFTLGYLRGRTEAMTLSS